MNHKQKNVLFFAQGTTSKNLKPIVFERIPSKSSRTFRPSAFPLTPVTTADGNTILVHSHENIEQTLDTHERIEFMALVFYITKIHGLKEESLWSELDTKFNISSVDDIQKYDFPAIRDYLRKRINKS